MFTKYYIAPAILGVAGLLFGANPVIAQHRTTHASAPNVSHAPAVHARTVTHAPAVNARTVTRAPVARVAPAPRQVPSVARVTPAPRNNVRPAWHGGVNHGGVNHNHGTFNHGGYYNRYFRGWWPGYYSSYWPNYGYPGYYGSNYYAPYAYDSTPYYDNSYYAAPSYVATSYAAPTDFATVRVILPDPLARVWFNGELIPGTGADRLITSPPLAAGSTYSYRIRASWMSGYSEMVQERMIEVSPGATSVVDFRQPAPVQVPGAY